MPGPGGSGGPTSVVVGQVQTATGGPINYGALTFSLSQAAVVAGSATIATEQTACYTSAQGNIVGIPDPLALPVLSVSLSSGTLPGGTYYVVLYYTGAGGVSAVSPEASINLSSQGTLYVNPPGMQPNSATGYGVAISTTPGAETIQGAVTGWPQYRQGVPLVTGGTPNALNTSFCSLYLSDQLVPTGTYYTVNLVNKNGSQISGFPQSWCMYGGAGATINVSNGAPTGNCSTTGVFYPTPLFANPPNTLVQSLQGGLNVGTTLNVAGNTTLSGAVNFLGAGPFSFPSISSASANRAQSGWQRLARTDALNWRNTANSGDEGLSVDGSDRLNVSHAAGVLLSGVNPNILFGGTSSSFPALFRNATELDAKLADNSGFTSFGASILLLQQQSASPTAVTGIGKIWSSTVDWMDHQTLPNLGQQQIPAVGLISSTYTNATTSFTTLNLSSPGATWTGFSVAANTYYSLTCQFTWQGSAGTTGPKFQVVVPGGTIVALNMTSAVTTTTGIFKSSIGTGNQSVANTGTITAATDFPATVTAGNLVSATPGTISLQAAANGAGTLTIEVGSFCVFQ